MLSTSGYFKDISCPFLKSGLCERSHCHYRHDLRYEITPSTSKRPIPDYVPTPVSRLKTAHIQAIDGHKPIPTDNNKSKLKIQNIYQNIPEYKPTPISELKKSMTSHVLTNDGHMSSISSSDELTNEKSKNKIKKSLDMKPNVKPKNVTKSETKVSKSIEKSNEKSIKSKTMTTIKATKDFESDSNEELFECLNRISNSSNRKQSLDDIFGTTDEGYDKVSKKVRIAHQITNNLTPKKLEKKPLRPTPSQVMQSRFAIQANSVQPKKKPIQTNAINSAKNVCLASSKVRIAHKPNSSSADTLSSESMAGKRRIAHKPNECKRPVLVGGIGNKFSLKLRQLYLNKFIDEYLVFCTEDEAFKRALESEKSVYDRSKSENIYKVFSVHSVKRIRDEYKAQQNSSPSKMTAEQMKKFGNQAVSHEKILNGKILGTFSVEKRQKSLTAEDLNDVELFKMLSKYIMSETNLKEYGYPLTNPSKTGSALLPKLLATKIRNNYESQVRCCSRCLKVYTVDDYEMPTRKDTCIFHSGRLWSERFNKSIEKKYSCCKNDVGAGGCCSNPYHIIDGFDRPDYCDNYVRTLPLVPPPQSGCYGIYGLDCEMCYTTHGLELTRVTVVNVRQQTIYESLVKPLNPILDYNSKFSGIKESDLRRVTTTLTDVQSRLQSLFNDKTILIGHSLESDLKALRLIHNTVIDTAQVFPHKRGLPYKRALRTLTAEFLQKIIQDDVEGHDSREDATAALKLMLWKVSEDLKKFKR